ncbi:hypothetical protein G3260_003430 [Streptomyces albus]|uniref:Uncharacterized protein n=2 Tax=Streptomyces TaxID=1883 RepID=A0A6C1C4U4_9ACTN|nr:hypothetical protein G3260_003430 [Streptomyces albus]TGG81714.1 hypothetical protein D8771_18215 [Streptomyces albus]
MRDRTSPAPSGLCHPREGSLGSWGMAHNPHMPQGPDAQGHPDPAGSTQMFRAFVHEGAPQQGRRQPAPAPAGPRIGVIVGVVVAVLVLAGVAWLAFS